MLFLQNGWPRWMGGEVVVFLRRTISSGLFTLYSPLFPAFFLSIQHFVAIFWATNDTGDARGGGSSVIQCVYVLRSVKFLLNHHSLTSTTGTAAIGRVATICTPNSKEQQHTGIGYVRWLMIDRSRWTVTAWNGHEDTHTGWPKVCVFNTPTYVRMLSSVIDGEYETIV